MIGKSFRFFSLLAEGVNGGKDLSPTLIRIEFDVVPYAVGWPETDDAVAGKHLFSNDPLKQPLGVFKKLRRLGADYFVLKNGGEFPVQLPGLEKRRPVNVILQFFQVEIPENLYAEQIGTGDDRPAPIHRSSVLPRMFQTDVGFDGALTQMLLTCLAVFLGHFTDVFIPCFLVHQVAGHLTASGRVQKLEGRTGIPRAYFDVDMDPGSSCHSKPQRVFESYALHLYSRVQPFVQGGSDKSARATHVHVFLSGGCQKC